MDIKNRNIHLVDFSYFLHRGYHSMHNMKVEVNGFMKPVGHILGVLNYIKKIKDYDDKAIVFLALDDLPVHKIQLLESVDVAYKDGRAKNEYNIRQDTNLICDLAYYIPDVYSVFSEGEEADDIIASLTYKYKKDNRIFIHSSDKDLVQLLDRRCYIITEWDNGTPIKTTLDSYKTSEKYEKAFLNCNPYKLTYFRAIVGDASDNLKGLYRFPRKLAKLIAENTSDISDFKNATNKYARLSTPTQMKYLTLLEESYDKVAIYYEVMKLKTDLPLEISRTLKPIKKTLDELKLKSYINYLKIHNIDII